MLSVGVGSGYRVQYRLGNLENESEVEKHTFLENQSLEDL